MFPFPSIRLAAALFLLAGSSGCASGTSRPVSDHFDGERFFNPGLGAIDKSFWELMKWQWGGTRADWPDSVAVQPGPAPVVARGASATFVNHATFVVRFPGAVILTDPIWSKRCSPVSFAGPKRVHAPGVSWNDLPKVDVVVISHNHYDHLDLPTLKNLAARDNPLFLVPLGNKNWLEEEGLGRVEEMDWWQSRREAGVTFTFLPSQHWSSRTPWDRNETLWGSWGFSGADGTSVYHGGDTGYGPHFREIRRRWGAPDLALIPIGAYAPEWFMRESHLNPEDALRAFEDLGARRALGMHFGTFQLTDEARDEPALRLRRAAGARDTLFHVPEPGRSFFAAGAGP